MNSFSILLAWRYLRGTKNEKSIATMVTVCCSCITISVFALTLVMAIMNGIEQATYTKLQSIHAHIIMRAHGQELDVEAITPILKSEFPEIIGYSPSSIEQIIIQTDGQQRPTVLALKAIDPHKEETVTHLSKKIVTTDQTNLPDNVRLNTSISNNKILIGNKLATDLNISQHDTITLLFSPQTRSSSGRSKIALEQYETTLGGLFTTGIEEFDTSLAFCSFELLETLFPDTGVTQLNIKLRPTADIKKTTQKLRARFNNNNNKDPLEIYSWNELYPALVSALQLEKYAMFIILSLIILVSSMTIIALLFMLISQKRLDIAILKAMGMSDKNLRATFMIIGMSIALLSSLVGIFLAVIACYILKLYPFITLPDAYYFTHLPADITGNLLITVITVVMLVSACATWFSARRSTALSIARVLRFE